MHPRFMRRLAVVFAGGALCSALLACVVHDDTKFPNLPQPGDTASPTRTVVDSGLVIFSEDDGGGVPVGGGAGEITPDAAVLPDSSPDLARDLATAELGGVGSSCRPLIQTDCTNRNPALACYPGANGTGFCSFPNGTAVSAGCTGSLDCAVGYYCGNGRTSSNICLLLCDVENPGCAKSSPCVQVPGFKDNTGYCLE
jgi:hypothetical protein